MAFRIIATEFACYYNRYFSLIDTFDTSRYKVAAILNFPWRYYDFKVGDVDPSFHVKFCYGRNVIYRVLFLLSFTIRFLFARYSYNIMFYIGKYETYILTNIFLYSFRAS